MRFWILLLSARSDILVQSSSGFAELLKALLVPCCPVEKCLGVDTWAEYEYWCWDMAAGPGSLGVRWMLGGWDDRPR